MGGNLSIALTDLANLIELLETQEDWQGLIPYARIFFERTRDIAACRVATAAKLPFPARREFTSIIAHDWNHRAAVQE